MSPARGRSALVVVGSGPDTERGWLGLRTALALGVAGCEVTVWLCGAGTLFARDLDATVWLGGDPRADLDGLIDELGARILVERRAVADGDGVAARLRRPELEPAGEEEFAAAVVASGSLLAF